MELYDCVSGQTSKFLENWKKAENSATTKELCTTSFRCAVDGLGRIEKLQITWEHMAERVRPKFVRCSSIYAH